MYIVFPAHVTQEPAFQASCFFFLTPRPQGLGELQNLLEAWKAGSCVELNKLCNLGNANEESSPRRKNSSFQLEAVYSPSTFQVEGLYTSKPLIKEFYMNIFNICNTRNPVKEITPGPLKAETELKNELFQEAINSVAIDRYQEFCMTRNLHHRNFIFFTPNLIGLLSMLYTGAPEYLKGVMEDALHMGELKGELWHIHFQNWIEGLQNRQALPELLPSLLKADQVRLKFQQIHIIASTSNAPLIDHAIDHLSYHHPQIYHFKILNNRAEKTINNAVAELSEGKIKDFVKCEKSIILILASAALFKGQWQYPFDPKNNSNEVFFNSDGSQVEIAMMNKKIDNLRLAYDYNREKNYSIDILELPFYGDVSLLFFKFQSDTRSRNEAQEFVSHSQDYMTQENIKELLKNYDQRFTKRRALTLGIPKISFKEKMDVLKELKDTPLAQAIATANFNGNLVRANEIVKAPQLLSEINFTIDEEGAAISAATYSPTGYMSCDPSFKLNAPFGLMIFDKTTKTILGMGQVSQMEGAPVIVKKRLREES